MTTKTFHISAILSVSTGILLTPFHPDYINTDSNGIDAMYELLKYMTHEDSIGIIEAMRLADECAYYLPEWAQNARAEFKAAGKTGFEATYARLVAEHGEWHEISPIPMDDHDPVSDPVTEFKRAFPDQVHKLVSVEITDEPPISDVGEINWKVEGDE